MNEEKPNRPCGDSHRNLVRIGEPAALEYWRSPEELRAGVRASRESPGDLPWHWEHDGQSNTRRDFLSLAGFSLAAAGLAGCRAPVQNAIPLVAGSDAITPGVSRWYATTCGGCPSACSLLVKQRDGRPIKIEGNDLSALFGGGTCATGQATILSLYDDRRLRGPLWQGKPAKWVDIDQLVATALRTAEESGRDIVLVSQTLTSPSILAIVAGWREKYRNFRHVVYDAVSFSALRAAGLAGFGIAAIPHYSFNKARAIVALEADFLGTWLSPVEFAHQYSQARRAADNRAIHIQFESGLSVTGSNADVREPVAPFEIGAVALGLLRRVAMRLNAAGPDEAPELASHANAIDTAAEALLRFRGESLVVSGVQDLHVHTIVHTLNALLGNFGRTLDLARPSLQRAGDDRAMAELVDRMNRGQTHTLIFDGVNPAYDYADPERFMVGLDKVPLSISLSGAQDETSAHTHAICPDHHFLESWGDAEPVDAALSLSQPLITPLFDTRSSAASLLQWLGRDSDHYTYLREFWRNRIFPRQKESGSFQEFWDRSLQNGVVTLEAPAVKPVAAFHGDWKAAARAVAAEYDRARAARSGDRYELHLYESVAMRDGRHANNPWLQELPDPISKVTWDNFAAVSPKLAHALELSEGDVVRLTTESASIELPVSIQPGQESGTISVALGYGRREAGKTGTNVGVNAFPLATLAGEFRCYHGANVSLFKTGRRRALAGTQTHFSMEGRPIVLETTPAEMERGGRVESAALETLWAERLHGDHAWGMVVDLNACTGCSACVVACQAENNVPVVGRDQVRRTRIMHWIRIDRYYSGSEDNPAAVHQPMMCQQCGHAPCETVCPVGATSTSSEGINQQVYNRCIGTRYCMNNCPYKVRRFNFLNFTQSFKFDFNMNSALGRLVLNPDVVVRSRGVMEKCNLCVQRIQLAKNLALQEKRGLKEGDIQTACQQACPAQAIVFGDYKDPNSRLARLRRDRRHYQVLEELGTRPNVGYLKKVRHTEA